VGLSIHYSGIIRSMNMLDELITETADICQSLGWTYHVINEAGDDKLKGIIFSPVNCETVMLTFLPDGRICSFVNLMNRDMYDGVQFDKDLMYTTSTKTQFAGAEAHMALIKLLHYLKEKYFKEFELQDESQYWETGDEKILLRNFARYEYALEFVKNTLTEMKAEAGEKTESLISQIEKLLNEKWKGFKNPG
jgi:hypothetical protein